MSNRRLVPIPTAREQPESRPPADAPIILPRRRAMPQLTWPLQRHDWLALIAAVCFAALFWNWRHLIALVLIVYGIGRAYVALCYRFPRSMYFVTIFLCALISGGRRRR